MKRFNMSTQGIKLMAEIILINKHKQDKWNEICNYMFVMEMQNSNNKNS